MLKAIKRWPGFAAFELRGLPHFVLETLPSEEMLKTDTK